MYLKDLSAFCEVNAQLQGIENSKIMLVFKCHNAFDKKKTNTFWNVNLSGIE